MAEEWLLQEELGPQAQNNRITKWESPFGWLLSQRWMVKWAESVKMQSYNTAFVCLKTFSLTSPPALPALLQILFLLGKVIMNYLNSLIQVVSYLKRSLLWGLAEAEGLGSRPWFAWSREAQIQAVLGRWFEAESFVVFPHFMYFCWSKNPQKEVNVNSAWGC